MLKKNDIIEIEITDITNLGFGVGRFDGQIVFASGAVTGDYASVKIIKVNKSYAIARVEKIIKSSPHRCEGFCHHKSCKSCAYKEINYSHELSLKGETIRAAFHSQNLDGVTVESVTPSPSERAYRNKAQYPIAKATDGSFVIGFYAPKSHRVTDAVSCPLAPDVFAKINTALAQFFKEQDYTAYDEESGIGLLRHIYLRRSEKLGEVLLTLVINGDSLPKSDELIAMITAKFPEIVGILINVNKENTNVVLGRKYITLYGKEYIRDELCEVDLKITAPSFYQVNHDATELLYSKARELADLHKSDTLLDLFCGIGSIGLSMASDAAELIGIEIVDAAVECAKENAKNAGIENAHFYAGDATQTELLLANAEEKLGRKILPDVVILDPPRAGCDEKLVDFVSSLNPKRIVYISCNPQTLARDTKRFFENGYTTDKVFGFDLFPKTGHVESVLCLTKA